VKKKKIEKERAKERNQKEKEKEKKNRIPAKMGRFLKLAYTPVFKREFRGLAPYNR